MMCCCPPLQPHPVGHSDVSLSRGQTSACAALWECDASGRKKKTLHRVTQTSPSTWRKPSKCLQKNVPRWRDERGDVGGRGGARINPPSKWKRAAGLTRHFHGHDGTFTRTGEGGYRSCRPEEGKSDARGKNGLRASDPFRAPKSAARSPERTGGNISH